MPCRATPLPPHFHFLLLPLLLPTLCSSLPFLFSLSTIWPTFPFPYVSPMPPTCHAPSLYSPCTSLVPTAPSPPPPPRSPPAQQWAPSGSPAETPGRVQLCAGMMWLIPRDHSRMYIKTPEVGTEEVTFFSPFPLQASSLVSLLNDNSPFPLQSKWPGMP